MGGRLSIGAVMIAWIMILSGCDEGSRRPPTPTSTVSGDFSYVPFFYVDESTRATLELTNNSSDFEDARIVLLLAGRERVALGRFSLPPGTKTPVDIGERLGVEFATGVATGPGRWGTGDRPGSVWGSVEIQGNLTRVSGWVVSWNPVESLCVNSMLTRSGGGRDELCAHWYRPTPSTHVQYVIQNVGLETTVPTASLGPETWIGSALSPGQSSLVSLADLLGDESPKDVPDVGSIRFQSTSGRLSLTAMTCDETTGFSSALGAHDLQSRASNSLESPGFPLGKADPEVGFPTGTLFAPALIVSNQNVAAPIRVEVFLRGRNPGIDPFDFADFVLDGVPYYTVPVGDGQEQRAEVLTSWDELRVLEVELAPGETQLHDIGELGIGSGLDTTLAGLAVVSDDEEPGSLMADLVVADQTLTYSFYDPLFDVAVDRQSHVAISFDLSGSRNTAILVNNTADEGGFASLRIRYRDDGGVLNEYVVFRPLGVGEIISVDLEALRDWQVPDAEGRTLPPDLETGYVHIRTSGGVITGDPTYDVQAGTCFSCSSSDECSGFCGVFVFSCCGNGCIGLEVDGWYSGLTPCGCQVAYIPGTNYSAIKVGYEVEECPLTGTSCYQCGGYTVCP